MRLGSEEVDKPPRLMRSLSLSILQALGNHGINIRTKISPEVPSCHHRSHTHYEGGEIYYTHSDNHSHKYNPAT